MSKQIWVGRGISWLCAFFFLGGAIFGLITHDPKMAEGMAHLGWPADMQSFIVGLEMACALIYVIPYTSVLGAILLTGYLGGAIATHLRVGEHEVWFQVILGVLIWAGLWLRTPALRGLIPLKK